MKSQSRSFIYLDHNATTPVDPSAAEAMMPFIQEEFGNPSSPYPLGTRAKQRLEQCRQEVAKLLGCKRHEIVFTSGGSESNNMVLKGIVDLRNPANFHIITSAVEHPAIINPLLFLEELGVGVSVLPVDAFGLVDPEEVARAIKPHTSLISIMLANNETGTLQPIREISQLAREHGIPLHTDAAQAIGKIPVAVDELGADFLSVAGHKLYAPKGVGVLFIREDQNLTPLIHGAGQEGGKRPGTENLILSVGLGVACQVARERLQADMKNMTLMRDRLQEILFRNLEGLVLNGHPEQRLPNTLNVSVPHIEGNKILDGLPSLYASTGAACHDRSVELSHVLSAMGVPPEVGMGALRLTVGRTNDMEQIEEAGRLIVKRVKELRGDRKNI
ncbi:MAG: cysteine desulfurase [Nitrospira bacterium SG8_3]|nr:MAG: cysteine desulfurase [Nitrospira bacterium SG8_3]